MDIVKNIQSYISVIIMVAVIPIILIIRKKVFDNVDTPLTIKIVTDERSCKEVTHELKRRCKTHKALGFDCEWVTIDNARRPVALLQLSTYDGYCGLFRLNILKGVPDSLKELLEDPLIYKVGVVPFDDASYLFQDYNVNIQSTLDIRHIVELAGHKTGGLAMLSKMLLGVTLDKNGMISCSNWEEEKLSNEQLNYAALDAFVAIKIFVNLTNSMSKNSIWSYLSNNDSDVWENINETYWQYTDRKYRKSTPGNPNNLNQNTYNRKKNGFKNNSSMLRKKPLYHNCFLEDRDGIVLCTCDFKKAMWYHDKGLGVIIQEDPLTVRLNFEPAGRAVGDAGRFYKIVKENRCVVCGLKESYIRKNVVPKEYRKYFPEVMKDHSSHDVLLLCSKCHQRSNIADNSVREELAKRCDAPISRSGFSKRTVDATAKSIRGAANILCSDSPKIPEERKQSLKKQLLEHFTDYTEVTEELLQKASKMQVFVENETYEVHGEKVVEYFIKNVGLTRLEEIWRKHFIATMQPRYMPPLWSLNHNEQRLRIRLSDGRLTEENLKSIGPSDWIEEFKLLDVPHDEVDGPDSPGESTVPTT